jgi:lactoylglutathione lyase
MMATFHSAFPMLACHELEASLRFYRDLLGFEVTYRFPTDGDGLFYALQLGGAGLGLGSTRFPPIHGRANDPRSGHVFELCVYTVDLDAAMTRLRDADVPVLVEPMQQPWGERIAYVTDPDDNPVMVATKANGT